MCFPGAFRVLVRADVCCAGCQLRPARGRLIRPAASRLDTAAPVSAAAGWRGLLLPLRCPWVGPPRGSVCLPGALSKRVIDVDGDGRVDTAWITGGSTFGTTALVQQYYGAGRWGTALGVG